MLLLVLKLSIVIALGFMLITSTIGLNAVNSFADSKWTSEPAMPTPRSEAAGVLLNSKLYTIGGFGNFGASNKNIVEIYDINNKKWSTGTPLPVALNHAAAAVFNGKIYVVGGYLDNKVPSNKLYIFDPSLNKWTTGKDMPTPRAALTAQFVNGILYAIGGANIDFKKLDINEAYDPVTNSWSIKTPMPTARNHLTSSVVDGKIYAIGGRTSGPSGNLNTNEAYDPAQNKWFTKSSMPTPRGGIASAVINGQIYVFGGESPTVVFDKNEKYDPVKNTWSDEIKIPTPRHGLVAISQEGKIYVIGGGLEPTKSKPASGTNEVYEVTVTTTTPEQIPPPSTTPADIIAPSVKITSPLNDATVDTGQITISGTANDNADGSGIKVVEVNIDGMTSTYTAATPGALGDWSVWTTTKTVNAEGVHTFTARATDNAGNKKWYTVSVNVEIKSGQVPSADTVAPDVKITYPVSNTNIDPGIILVKGTSSDIDSSIKIIEIQLDGGTYTIAKPTTSDWSTWEGTKTINSEGSHKITVRATDNAGNKKWNSVTFTIG